MKELKIQKFLPAPASTITRTSGPLAGPLFMQVARPAVDKVQKHPCTQKAETEHAGLKRRKKTKGVDGKVIFFEII